MSNSEAEGELIGLERVCESGGGESTSSSTELEFERERERNERRHDVELSSSNAICEGERE